MCCLCQFVNERLKLLESTLIYQYIGLQETLSEPGKLHPDPTTSFLSQKD